MRRGRIRRKEGRNLIIEWNRNIIIIITTLKENQQARGNPSIHPSANG